MKRRDLFKAAALVAAVDLPDGVVPWPSAQKLGKQKREVIDQMAKVRLRNGDAPDGLPRPPLPRRRK
jgi:hypothetical protein